MSDVSCYSESTSRPKIAFLTHSPAWDRRAWSGTFFFLATTLQRYCGEVVHVQTAEPIATRICKASKYINGAMDAVFCKRYDFDHSTYICKRRAKFIENQLQQDFDLVFAPGISGAIAYLETSLPIVYLSDATFTSVKDYYKAYSRLFKFSERESNTVEYRAIHNSSLLIYTSEWAKKSAVEDYGADPSKVHVLSFGANIDPEQVPERDLVVNRTRSDHVRLLFLGVEWQRKGGDIALDTLIALEKMGVPAELTVCGCVPPERTQHSNLKVVPFLNKKDPEQRERFVRLLLESDFLLLPTRADCTPMVFCEASTFGLPIITTDTGGISGLVKNGENGFRLPVDATGMDFAKFIYELWADHDRYDDLVMRSRNLFETMLNWDAWGRSFKQLLENIGIACREANGPDL